MPVMNFDLEDGLPPVSFSLKASDAERFVAFMAECDAALKSAQTAPLPLQQRVQPWMMECFGPIISADTQERNHRFLEEALELVQACGATQSEAHQLVDYVYGRPVGDRFQEVGGVMITLAALCLAQQIDMHIAGEVELSRIWKMVDQIRAKQAAKPKHSPLPAVPETWKELPSLGSASAMAVKVVLQDIWVVAGGKAEDQITQDKVVAAVGAMRALCTKFAETMVAQLGQEGLRALLKTCQENGEHLQAPVSPYKNQNEGAAS